MEKTVKTSVKLPHALWKRAHVRALDEDRDLQDLIAAAIELYLRTPLKREEGANR